METSLHRTLKEQFGSGPGGRVEVAHRGYRIDAVDADGTLVEVQSGALGPLRGKLSRLLESPGTRVRVVKPVVLTRRVVRSSKGGVELSSRQSPKRGALVDVFDDLIGLACVFPHTGLVVEVLGVAIDEVRVARRRRPGFAVVDRRLREVVERASLVEAEDLWSLLPDGLDGAFTTRGLAHALGRPLAFAQRVAYCLRLSGAVEAAGKTGNHHVYRRVAAGVTA